MRFIKVFVAVLACVGASAHAASYQVGQRLSGVTDLGLFWHIPEGSSEKVYSKYFVPTANQPGFSAVAGGHQMTGKGALALSGGRSLVIDVATKVTAKEIAAGAARFLAGPGGLALAVGIPLLVDYLGKNKMRVGPSGLEQEVEHEDGIIWTSDVTHSSTEVKLSPSENCRRLQGPTSIATYQNNGTGPGTLNAFYTCSGPNGVGVQITRIEKANSVSWDPITIPEAEKKLNILPETAFIPKMLEKGADFKPEPSVVTGPASVAGEPKVTTGSDGKTTTQQTTEKATYSGDKVKTTTDTTSTTTTPNPDGSTTEDTTTTTEDTKPEDDLCVKHPDIVACESGDVADTPLPPVPKLYEPKYPDGLIGVWNEKRDQLAGTSLLGVMSKFMPTSVGSKVYPVLKLPLDVGLADFGEADLSPPNWVWDFGGLVVVLSALLLARALIFGG